MSSKNSQYSLFFALFLIAFLTPVICFSMGGGGPVSDEPWLADECRSCHDNYEDLPLKASNPDTHHLKYGTVILHTTAPNAETDTDGLYDCLTCHSIAWNETGDVSITLERDCLQCHELQTVANRKVGNRHHETETSIQGRCDVCHCRMPEPHRTFNYCSSNMSGGMR